MARRERSERPSRRSGPSRPSRSKDARDLEEVEAQRALSREDDYDDGPDEDEPRSGRRSRGRKGKRKKGKKGKKRIDVMPVLMVLLLLGAGAAAALYFPMQRRTLTNAVRGGERLGFDAAIEISKSSSPDIAELCGIVEQSSSGRMAAAAALARIARRGGAKTVVGTITKRLVARESQEALPAEAKAAYAAALAQSRSDAGEQAAAALAKDGNAAVRLAAITGLGYGRTSAGPPAVGGALADADEEVRNAAKGAMLDWAVAAPEKALAAALVGIELEEKHAQRAAAEVMLEVADKLGPDHALALLSKESSEVRELGLEALQRNPSLVTGGGPVADAVVGLLDMREQPFNVKSAALDVALGAGLPSAGPKALAMLKSDPDPEIRGKAALAVARACPEGAWEALSAPLMKRDEPRLLKIDCLEALASLRKAPADKLPEVTLALLKTAEGKDKTLAGLALGTMKVVTGKTDAKYGVEQWRKYVGRRVFEAEAVVKAAELFEKMKKEYDADPDDWERIKKVVEEAGLYLQEKVIENADADDKQPMQTLVTEMVRFNQKIRKPLNR